MQMTLSLADLHGGGRHFFCLNSTHPLPFHSSGHPVPQKVNTLQLLVLLTVHGPFKPFLNRFNLQTEFTEEEMTPPNP